MALINWNSNLSVGVSEIDQQHQKLIQLINELHENMKLGKGSDVVGKTINELVSYTKKHFALEEKYFTQYNYSGKNTHIAEHQKLVKSVLDFKEKYDKGNGVVTIEVINFLSSWLKDHILGTDKKYASFFQEKGLK